MPDQANETSFVHLELDDDLANDLYELLLADADLDVRFSHPEETRPELRRHSVDYGSLALDGAQLTTLFIAASGLLTSIISLAAALVSLAKERMTQAKKEQDAPTIVIYVEGTAVRVTSTDAVVNVAEAVRLAIASTARPAIVQPPLTDGAHAKDVLPQDATPLAESGNTTLFRSLCFHLGHGGGQCGLYRHGSRRHG